MRKGGLEPKAALEMTEEFRHKCCAVWRLVAQIGPWGPIEDCGVLPLERDFQVLPHPVCSDCGGKGILRWWFDPTAASSGVRR
jgi:hypothetical protein